MICPFVVGQHVVCVNEGGWARLPEFTLHEGPTKDQVLKIKSLFPFGLGIGLGFQQFPGGYFHHAYFRPLQDRPKEADTDISCFAPLLVTAGPGRPVAPPVRVPEREDARLRHLTAAKGER